MLQPESVYKKLNLQGFSHVSFVVKSLEESRRFYRDLLGFSEVVRPGSLKERGIHGCWLFNFGVGLHLIEGDPPKRKKELIPEADHFSFQCENIKEVEMQLQALNVEYISDEVDHEGFCISQLFFHDPDDNMIEICNCDSAPLKFLESIAAEHCCIQHVQNITVHDITATPTKTAATAVTNNPNVSPQKRPQWQSGH